MDYNIQHTLNVRNIKDNEMTHKNKAAGLWDGTKPDSGGMQSYRRIIWF